MNKRFKIASLVTVAAVLMGMRFFGIERKVSSQWVSSSLGAEVSEASGQRTCITGLDVVSDAAYTLSVVDEGLGTPTTMYSFTLSANQGLVRDWDDENALCGVSGSSVTINVSAGTFGINYKAMKY